MLNHIGGAFSGGGGSHTGPLIAGSLAVLSSGKNHIQIPAGTLVEVPLKVPLVIKQKIRNIAEKTLAS